MKRAYLGRSTSSQPMAIDCQREYSSAVYQKLTALLQREGTRNGGYAVLKRFFDCLIAVTLLILLSPLMAGIALAVALSGKGGILFRQERIGKDGKLFICYKFRTMTKDAPPSCPSQSLKDRERYITAVGKFLRRYSLDELPQLFCVVTGKMSLVGYRPLVREDAECHALREQLSVYRMRPGMTGYAQLMGRDYVLGKNKALLDAYYVKNASFGWDLRLLLQTVLAAVSGRGNRDAV